MGALAVPSRFAVSVIVIEVAVYFVHDCLRLPSANHDGVEAQLVERGPCKKLGQSKGPHPPETSGYPEGF